MKTNKSFHFSDDRWLSIARHIHPQIDVAISAEIRRKVETIIDYCERVIKIGLIDEIEATKSLVTVARFVDQLEIILRYAKDEFEEEGRFKFDILFDFAQSREGLEQLRGALGSIFALLLHSGEMGPVRHILYENGIYAGSKAWLHRSIKRLYMIWLDSAGERTKKDFVCFCEMIFDGSGLGVTRHSITESLDRHALEAVSLVW